MKKALLLFKVLFFISTYTFSQTAVVPAGSGTSGDPYQIATLENLYWLTQTTSIWAAGKYFIQTADINAAETMNWNDGKGWLPIGKMSVKFKGVYNGQFHIIDSLYINRPTTDNVGFFGYTYASIIKNLGLTNVNVRGYSSVGGLAGLFSGEYNVSNYTSNCFTTGIVRGYSLVGGLAGFSYYSHYVKYCYSTCTVVGTYAYIGGLIGSNDSGMWDSYATGDVSGNINIGGLVGSTDGLSRCYATGAVSGNSNVGGLAGDGNPLYVFNSYWDKETSGCSYSSFGTGKTTAQMKSLSTYINGNWDFMCETANGNNNYWGMNPEDNDGYPFLHWQGYTHAQPPQGSGSEFDPYQIAILENLFWLTFAEAEWDMHYIQTADINASSTPDWHAGAGFNPVGKPAVPFSGSYDGQGFSIDALYIDRSAMDNVGFFGYTTGSNISSLLLTNVNITGRSQTGALVGYHCESSGVNFCGATGTVSGYDQTGGLVGYNQTTSGIYDSWAHVSVSGNQRVGGFCGYNLGSTMDNCYSLGAVAASYRYAGGFAGMNMPDGSISNCYSTGTITCSGSGVGGLVGYNGAEVNNSFWDMETSGKTTSAGGIGKTTAEMITCSTYANAGWLFPATWHLDESPTPDNQGYPSLAWQNLNHITFPSIATDAITEIGGDTAVGHFTFIDLGSPNPSAHGICWSISPNPTINDQFSDEGSIETTGSFTSILNNLNPSTTYYARAYATNTAGTSYGVEIEFETILLGSGTPEDPYLVTVLNELEWLSNNSSAWDKHIIQVADIDASATASWNNGQGFSPIGNSETFFTGVYDGMGFEIDGIYISTSEEKNVGLFGSLNSATVKNLGLKNVNITSSATGYYATGALVAYCGNDCVIENCFSTGSVAGYRYVGGLVGGQKTNSQTSNSYALVEVSGTYDVGGLFGYNSSSNIENCYAAGSVNSGTKGVGGLIGGVYSGATCSNSFWDTETSGQTSSAGGTGLTTAQMREISVFTMAGWDYCGETSNGTEDFWSQDGTTNNGYPFFTGKTTSWTGYTSSDWNAASNWHNNTLPQTGETISMGCAQNPAEINGLVVCNNNINIGSTGCITIKPDGKLTLSGSVNNHGSIHIEASPAGTGSLIHQTPNLQASIDCYFEEDQWHAITPPVSNGLAGVFEGSYLKFYSEPDSIWTYISSVATPLAEGRGYFVWNYENETVTYSGLLNSGDFNPNLTYTSAAQHGGKGWNLVGNPYPSYINYDGSWPTSNLDETIYLYNGTQYVTWNGSVGAHGSGEIAPGQAFWVHAHAENPGLTIPDAKRMHGTQSFYKNESSDYFTLKVSGNGYDDQSIIMFNSMATHQFDTKWDAYKLMGHPEAPQLYTTSAINKLSVNALPKDEEVTIPLSLITGTEGIYTLAPDNSAFNAYNHVYLEDKFNENITDLKTAHFYSFYANPEDDPDRFLLHFTGEELIGVNRPAVAIYAYNNTVYVSNPSLSEGVIFVYDLLGRITAERPLSAEQHTLKIMQKGYFVVSVISGNNITSQKVWIR